MSQFFKFEHIVNMTVGVQGYVLYSEIAGWDYLQNAGTIYLKGGAEIDVGAETCHQLEDYFGIVDEAISEAEEESIAGAHQNPAGLYHTVRK